MGLIRPEPRVTVYTDESWDQTNPVTHNYYGHQCEFKLRTNKHNEEVLRLQVVPPPQAGLEAIEIPYDQLLEMMEEIRE